MRVANGGSFVGDWTLVVFVLAALMVVASIAGAFRSVRSSWSIVAVGPFTGYAGWTCAFLLWFPNLGGAWLSDGQTLL